VRILLVEDHPVNQLVATELLSRAGYSCDVVADGQSAVDAALSGHYQLVLMDCQMPVMDGYDATRLIRKHEASLGAKARRLPIIAMTANAVKGDREACLAAGMDEYISKPIDQPRLLKTIQAVLPSTILGSPPASLDSVVIRNPIPPGSPVHVEEFLERCMTNVDLAVAMLDCFERQVGNDLQNLRRAVAEQNLDLAARSAHTIKGSAANLSAEAVRASAFEIEKAARGHLLEESQRQLDLLVAEVDRCLAYLPNVRQQLFGYTRPMTEETVTPIPHSSLTQGLG